MYPTRFSAADRALCEALVRLDARGVREALLDGADPDMPNGEGSLPLYWLFSWLSDRDEANPSARSLDDERAAACAEELLARGSTPYQLNRQPATNEQVELCPDREHDCRGCPFGADRRPYSDQCGGLLIAELVVGFDMEGRFPALCATFHEWLERHGGEDSNRHSRLLNSLREKLGAERQERILWKATAVGLVGPSDSL